MHHHVPMTTTQVESTDPLTTARTLMARAEALGNDAVEWRRSERHDLAGRCREEQRALMKRAEVDALIGIGDALTSIADDMARIGLSR